MEPLVVSPPLEAARDAEVLPLPVDQHVRESQVSVDEDDKMSLAPALEYPSDLLAHLPAFRGVRSQPSPDSEASNSLCRSLRPIGFATCASISDVKSTWFKAR